MLQHGWIGAVEIAALGKILLAESSFQASSFERTPEGAGGLKTLKGGHGWPSQEAEGRQVE